MTQRIGRPPHPDVLTPAEWRVLDHVRDGRPNAEIAVRLGISVNTVRYHVSNMLAKLEVPDRHALAAWDGQPKRRFGWLPPIPPLTLGLGSLGRGAAIVGGGATVVAIVIAIVLAMSDGIEEPRTSIVARTSPGLIGIDPATGALLTGIDPLATGPLGPVWVEHGGGLIWIAEVDADQSIDITVLDGARLGVQSSGLDTDNQGVVRRWTLLKSDAAVFSGVSSLDLAPDGRTAYLFRSMTPSFDHSRELWKLDVNNGRATSVMSTIEPMAPINPLHITTAGDLFLTQVSPTALIQIDQGDGSEIDRLEFPGALRHSIFAADGRHLYLFHQTDQLLLTTVDLDTMTVVRTDALPPNSPRQWFSWTYALSPDRTRLYLAGDDLETCPDVSEQIGPPCWPQPIGVQAFDLETMEQVYDDPEHNQLALSPDGRWLVTTLWTYDQEGFSFRPPRGDGVKVIDTTTFEVVAHFEPGATVTRPVISADGRYAYVMSEGPGYPQLRSENCVAACGRVTVIDLERLQVVAKQVYDEYPLGFLLPIP